MNKNHPRILSTNTRMESGAFAHSWLIRGWSLGAAKVNVMREVESAAETGLVRAGRLRQAVLRSAFEGRLV
jgi:hypothetical protein